MANSQELKKPVDFAASIMARLKHLSSVTWATDLYASGRQANFRFESKDSGQFKVTVERIG